MKRIKSVPEEHVELISNVGAKGIMNLTRKYTNSELEMIEERARYMHIIDFWECGYKNLLLFLVIPLGIIGVACYVNPNFIFFFVKMLSLSQNGWAALIGMWLYLMLFNMYDVGRIIFSYNEIMDCINGTYRDKNPVGGEEFSPSLYSDNVEKISHELLYDIQTLVLERGGLSASQILKEMGINYNVIKFGKILKNSDMFIRKKTNKGRVWYPKTGIRKCK